MKGIVQPVSIMKTSGLDRPASSAEVKLARRCPESKAPGRISTSTPVSSPASYSASITVSFAPAHSWSIVIWSASLPPRQPATPATAPVAPAAATNRRRETLPSMEDRS